MLKRLLAPVRLKYNNRHAPQCRMAAGESDNRSSVAVEGEQAGRGVFGEEVEEAVAEIEAFLRVGDFAVGGAGFEDSQWGEGFGIEPLDRAPTWLEDAGADQRAVTVLQFLVGGAWGWGGPVVCLPSGVHS